LPDFAADFEPDFAAALFAFLEDLEAEGFAAARFAAFPPFLDFELLVATVLPPETEETFRRSGRVRIE
jgi:hypothetical protein